MPLFSKLFALGLVGSFVAFPMLASNRGWGLRSERNAQIIQQASQYCPPHRRDALGNCPRTHRSYYYGRSYRGGGPRGGK